MNDAAAHGEPPRMAGVTHDRVHGSSPGPEHIGPNSTESSPNGLVWVMPPHDMPRDPPTARMTHANMSAYGPVRNFGRGTLMRLKGTLREQMNSIASEYALPSSGGMALYITCLFDDAHKFSVESVLSARGSGPKVNEDVWNCLFAPRTASSVSPGTVVAAIEFDIDASRGYGSWYKSWVASSNTKNTTEQSSALLPPRLASPIPSDDGDLAKYSNLKSYDTRAMEAPTNVTVTSDSEPEHSSGPNSLAPYAYTPIHTAPHTPVNNMWTPREAPGAPGASAADYESHDNFVSWAQPAYHDNEAPAAARNMARNEPRNRSQTTGAVGGHVRSASMALARIGAAPSPAGTGTDDNRGRSLSQMGDSQYAHLKDVEDNYNASAQGSSSAVESPWHRFRVNSASGSAQSPTGHHIAHHETNGPGDLSFDEDAHRSWFEPQIVEPEHDASTVSGGTAILDSHPRDAGALDPHRGLRLSSLASPISLTRFEPESAPHSPIPSIDVDPADDAPGTPRDFPVTPVDQFAPTSNPPAAPEASRIVHYGDTLPTGDDLEASPGWTPNRSTTPLENKTPSDANGHAANNDLPNPVHFGGASLGPHEQLNESHKDAFPAHGISRTSSSETAKQPRASSSSATLFDASREQERENSSDDARPVDEQEVPVAAEPWDQVPWMTGLDSAQKTVWSSSTNASDADADADAASDNSAYAHSSDDHNSDHGSEGDIHVDAPSEGSTPSLQMPSLLGNRSADDLSDSDSRVRDLLELFPQRASVSTDVLTEALFSPNVGGTKSTRHSTSATAPSLDSEPYRFTSPAVPHRALDMVPESSRENLAPSEMSTPRPADQPLNDSTPDPQWLANTTPQQSDTQLSKASPYKNGTPGKSDTSGTPHKSDESAAASASFDTSFNESADHHAKPSLPFPPHGVGLAQAYSHNSAFKPENANIAATKQKLVDAPESPSVPRGFSTSRVRVPPPALHLYDDPVQAPMRSATLASSSPSSARQRRHRRKASLQNGHLITFPDEASVDSDTASTNDSVDPKEPASSTTAPSTPNFQAAPLPSEDHSLAQGSFVKRGRSLMDTSTPPRTTSRHRGPARMDGGRPDYDMLRQSPPQRAIKDASVSDDDHRDVRIPKRVSSVNADRLGADTGAVHNGVQYNGIQYNGVQYNGVQYNGAPYNGVQTNGAQNNGVQNNGVQSNGIQYNGVHHNGLTNAAQQHDHAPASEQHDSSANHHEKPIASIKNHLKFWRSRDRHNHNSSPKLDAGGAVSAPATPNMHSNQAPPTNGTPRNPRVSQDEDLVRLMDQIRNI